jgi:hypothetical protein
MRYLARKYPGNVYTIISESGFHAIQESESVCFEKLAALGLTENESIDVLHARTVPHEWRSLFIQAAAAEATTATAALESAASSDELEAVRQQQAKLAGAVDGLRQELAADRLEQERREYETWFSNEFNRIRQVVIEKHKLVTPPIESLIMSQLMASPSGQRLEALRAN